MMLKRSHWMILLGALIVASAGAAEPPFLQDPNFPLIQLPGEYDSHRTTKRFEPKPGEEGVEILNAKGPGCVRHFWITSTAPERLEIEINCDDAEQPQIKMSMNRFFGVLLGQKPYRTESAPIKLLPKAADKVKGWHPSYKSGYRDDQGRYAGGSEIMHLVPHKGKLYAFNGYWTDANYGKQSAQVLRLDEPNGRWQVDLETNSVGYAHMKGNILKSVTFTTDKNGKKINETLLVAASRGKAVSVFVRDDATGKWSHSMQMQGKPGRLVPRDCEIFRDRVTGIDRIFLLVGDPGILSGVYNSETRSIQWDAKREHPRDDSVFPARPLGIAEANDRLYFSVGGKIFVRHDGPEPEWTLAYTIPGKVNTDVGGIRGLSTIKNPIGPGDSLIFVWTPAGRCAGEIKRLDGPDLEPAEDETSLRELFNKAMVEEKATAHFSLGGYNRLFPFKHPQTGETVHIVGYEQRIRADASLIWNHYYAGACYSIRYHPDEYTPHEVNGKWEPGKQVLVAPRAFALSPFEGEEDVIYFGGHDANFHPSTDMAWIYKADMATVLGLKPEVVPGLVLSPDLLHQRTDILGAP